MSRRRRIRFLSGRFGVAMIAHGPGGRLRVHATWLCVTIIGALALVAWRFW